MYHERSPAAHRCRACGSGALGAASVPFCGRGRQCGCDQAATSSIGRQWVSKRGSALERQAPPDCFTRDKRPHVAAANRAAAVISPSHMWRHASATSGMALSDNRKAITELSHRFLELAVSPRPPLRPRAPSCAESFKRPGAAAAPAARRLGGRGRAPRMRFARPGRGRRPAQRAGAFAAWTSIPP